MKIILLKDVAKIGRRFEVVSVPDGYALNQLIPKKMAEPATPANLKKVQQRAAGITADTAAGQERYETALAALKSTPIQIAFEANDQGHLFQAVHEADIVAAAATASIAIEAGMLVISSPVKEIGQHEVQLTFGNQTAAFTIEVIKK